MSSLIIEPKNTDEYKRQVLDVFFTEKAKAALSDVSLKFLEDTAYNSGEAEYGGPGGLIRGNGWNPVVKVSPYKLKERTLVHEYLHLARHLGLIDRTKFKKAFKKMSDEFPAHKRINFEVSMALRRYSPWQQFILGDDERTAYVGTFIRRRPTLVPEYMREVYANTLKSCEQYAVHKKRTISDIVRVDLNKFTDRWL